MRSDGAGKRLRIYVGEADTWHGRPLAHAIVLRAREAGLRGATVVRAIGGYGVHGVMHDAALIETEGDLPLVIELVDRCDRIEAFLPVLDEVVREGVVSIEDIAASYRPDPRPPARNGARPEGTATPRRPRASRPRH